MARAVGIGIQDYNRVHRLPAGGIVFIQQNDDFFAVTAHQISGQCMEGVRCQIIFHLRGYFLIMLFFLSIQAVTFQI